MYLWAGSNSCLFIIQFWRRNYKQLQALAAEPSSGLRLESSDPNKANFCLGCRRDSLTHLKNPPGAETQSKFAQITPRSKLVWCFYTKSSMVSLGGVSHFPAVALGLGVLKKTSEFFS